MRRILALALLLAFLPGRAATGAEPDGTAPLPTSTPSAAGDELLRGDLSGRGPGDEGAAGLSALQRGLPLSLPGPVDPATYRVGPGDLLTLQLWGKLTKSIPLEVGPEGTVLAPGAGMVFVAGRTLDQARSTLLALMRRQFRGVEMDLRLTRPRSFRVYLTGQVRVPGPTEATGAHRVGDVLTDGALLDGAARRRIEVLHRDGQREFCDLDLFLRSGDASFNPYLRDGDLIQVPTATEFVWAQGAVARPDRYELGVRDSLLTLLRLAGDPLPAAEVDRTLLVRFVDPFTPESLWVSLEDLYSRKVNPPLEDGMRYYVYFIPQYHQQHEATVVGEVQRPGVYPIVEGRSRLSRLLSAAGGFQSSADLSAIRVHRRNPAAGEKDPELDRLLRLSRDELTSSEYEVLRTKLAGLREDYRVDWSRLQGNKDLDLLLRDGDVVRVERLVSSIRIDGEVRRPGILNYVPGQRVEDYVEQVGGYTDRAWKSKVRVTRAVTGQILLGRSVRVLDPGDLIWVPEKPDPTTYRTTMDVLAALAALATIIIAVQSLKK